MTDLNESDHERSAANQIILAKADKNTPALHEKWKNSASKLVKDGVPVVNYIMSDLKRIVPNPIHKIHYIRPATHPLYDKHEETFVNESNLNEMSKEKLEQYKEKAAKDMWSKLKTGDKHTAAKRARGIHDAMKRDLQETHLVHIMRNETTGTKAHIWATGGEGGYQYEVEKTGGPEDKSKTTFRLPLEKVISHLSKNGYSELHEDYSAAIDSRGAYKPGTKVTVDGKEGEISYVHHEPDWPVYQHSYKVTDLSANDPYKQTRLRHGTYISHKDIKLA